MPPGTAPRRVSPGLWKTASGRTLPAGSAAIWEKYLRQGRTDGQGHFKNPAPPTRRQTVSNEKKLDYVRQEAVNKAPDYHRDLKTLGFQGASELNTIRHRMRKHIKSMYEHQIDNPRQPEPEGPIDVGAGKGIRGTSVRPRPSEGGFDAVADSLKGVAEGAAGVLGLDGVGGGHRWGSEGPTPEGIAEVERKIVKHAAEIGIGPDLTATLLGNKRSSWGLGLDVALLPFVGLKPLRAGRAAIKGGKAAATGESAKRAIQEGYDEPLRLHRGVRKRKGRAVQYGDLEQQFPESQSAITSAVQRKVLDPISEGLAPTAERLRGSESRAVRALGRLPMQTSAMGRAPKQAGKHLLQENKRVKARFRQEIRKLRTTRGRENYTHSWYAELPPEYQNAEGLQLVKNKLMEEHQDYLSGGFLRRVEARRNDLLEERSVAFEEGRHQDAWKIDAEIKKLEASAGDIEPRMRDLSEEIHKLGKVIDKPIDVDHSILEAARSLSADRTERLIQAGKLDPEAAAERPGLVSEWLGLEPSGEEIYHGHRAAKVSHSGGIPSAPSLGRTKLPEGVSSQNVLHLVKTGRARRDLNVIVDDWLSSLKYEFHTIAKEKLAAMGEDYHGQDVNLKTHALLNPNAHKIHPNKKLDQAAREEPEGFSRQFGEREEALDPEKLADADQRKYVEEYLATNDAAVKEMLARADDLGQLPDIKVVPRDVIKRFYGEFTNKKILAGTPGLVEEAGLVGKTGDLLQDVIYASIIYTNPGYIPANTVANLLMAGLHQGAFLPVNLLHAGQVFFQAPKRLRDMMLAEIGHGGSVAAASDTSPVRLLASAVGAVADNPARLSAFVHELKRAGVLAKSKPFLTKGDWARVEQFMLDPQHRALLNDISDRAVQSMVDFNRLGPNERMVARKLFFVWTWMRGGSRYPMRFAADHPLRTGLLAWVVAGAPGAPEEIQQKIHDILPDPVEGMPAQLLGALDASNWPGIGGVDKVMPTKSISPVSTPWDIYQSLRSAPGSQTMWEYVNPGIAAGVNVAQQRNPYGRETGSYWDAAKQAGTRLAPQAKLAQDLWHPPEEGGLYPEDTSRLGRLKRSTRVIPYKVDRDEAYVSRARQGMVSDKEKAEHKEGEFAQKSIKAGLGPPPPEVLQERKWIAELDEQLEDGMPKVERAKAAARVYEKAFKTTGVVESVPKDEAGAYRYYLWLRKQLHPYEAYWNRTIKKIEAQKAQ